MTRARAPGNVSLITTDPGSSVTTTNADARYAHTMEALHAGKRFVPVGVRSGFHRVRVNDHNPTSITVTQIAIGRRASRRESTSGYPPDCASKSDTVQCGTVRNEATSNSVKASMKISTKASPAGPADPRSRTTAMEIAAAARLALPEPGLRLPSASNRLQCMASGVIVPQTSCRMRTASGVSRRIMIAAYTNCDRPSSFRRVIAKSE